MEEFMKGSLLKTKRVGLVFTLGVMAVDLRGIGMMASSMGWGLILFHRMEN
jgi:hypothetical protein